MPSSLICASMLSICSLTLALTTGGIQEPSADGAGLLKGSVRLVETKEDAESTFKADLSAKGLIALIVTLSNTTAAATVSIRRADALLRTEFDEQLQAMEGQRAYDRLMMKVGGGPAFAEYGIGRAISEGSKKKTLRATVLEKAFPESAVLGPGHTVEATLFFERGKHTGTFRYSTLVIRDVLKQADGRSGSLSLPVGREP